MALKRNSKLGVADGFEIAKEDYNVVSTPDTSIPSNEQRTEQIYIAPETSIVSNPSMVPIEPATQETSNEPDNQSVTETSITSQVSDIEPIADTQNQNKLLSPEKAECKFDEGGLAITRGHKGISNKRFNFSISDENYNYIKKESRRRGLSTTTFLNYIIKSYREGPDAIDHTPVEY